MKDERPSAVTPSQSPPRFFILPPSSFIPALPRVTADFEIAAMLRDRDAFELRGFVDLLDARPANRRRRILATDNDRRDKEGDLVYGSRLEHQPGQQRASFEQHTLNRALAQFVQHISEVERRTLLPDHFHAPRLQFRERF